MNLSEDRFAARLEATLGAGVVSSDISVLAAHSVDGIRPKLVCLPENIEQGATLLRLCAEAHAAVLPWGGGTAMAIGNSPRALDVVIGLKRLNGLLEHDHANLTATVQSGISLKALQQSLARENQFLPFDPPHYVDATVGGIVAANINGPRRMFYGSVRDLVIGMKIFLASGEQIKAGGKVVKNVAGYDMCKLFVGSLGTLGIIVEVTVRMAPLPETVATLMGSGSLRAAHGFAAELARSTLLPAALFVLNPSASRLVNIEPAASAAVVWFEGFEETLVRQLRDSEAVARRHGLKTEVWREADHDRLWTEIGDFPLRHGHLVYGLTVPRASLAEIMQKIEEENSDFQADVIGDVSSGTLWLSTALTDEAARWFSQLVGLAEKRRGHAVMFAAPAKFKVGVDVWGAAPPGFAIMREIKQRFDPLMILNPGRFVGGL